MTKKDKIIYLLLGSIFLLGIFLRLYRLNLNTPELYSDEVGHYYYLHNLLNHDYPVVLKALTSLFTFSWLFGLNPLGARFGSALFGSLTLIAVFFFARSITKALDDKKSLAVSLVTSLLFAILPWNYAISRLGHTHVPIIVLAMLLHLALYINAKKISGKIISFIPFAIGSYYYPVMILMSPLILIPVAFDLVSKTKFKKQIIIAGTLLLITLGSLMVFKYRIFDSSSRGLDLAIWRDVNVTADANLYRGIARQSEPTIFSFGQNPEKIANKLFFNYPVSIFNNFARNYLSFFSPDFLFLKGDPVLRHSTSMVGNFYLFLLPFLLFGAYKFYALRTSHYALITLWILASPIPAAITKDGAGYLLRAITLMPILTYFCSLGIVYSFELFKNNFQKIVYGLVLGAITIFSAYYYFYGYFHVYPELSANSFEHGFKEIVDFQTKNPGKILIIWDDKYPYLQFCFWQKLPYEICDFAKTNTRVMVGDSRVDLPLPNVLFSLPTSSSNLELITKNYEPVYLALPPRYLERFKEYQSRLKKVETVLNPDGTTAFEVYQAH